MAAGAVALVAVSCGTSGSVPTSPTNNPPTASLELDHQSGSLPLTVQFDGTGSRDIICEPLTYEWNFGDGSAVSTAPTPSHTFTSAETFTVVLIVRDPAGLSDFRSTTVTVRADGNVRPTAMAGATPTSGAAPLGVTFSSSGSSDTDGTITEYAWDFGDGATSTLAAPTHTYSTPGRRIAELTVTDDRGDTATSTVVVTAGTNIAPIASTVGTASTLREGQPLHFQSSQSNDPDGLISRFSWDFGDSSATCEGRTPVHVYVTPGAYTATLSVTDAFGDTDTDSIVITVNPNQSPIAGITATPLVGPAPLQVLFDGAPSTDPDGVQRAYSWNWGDGTTVGTGVRQYHTFANPGSYTVTLTVTDENGATDTETVGVTVNPNQLPTASISASATTGIAPLAVTFDGSLSTDPEGTALTYLWNWGDGTADGWGPVQNHTFEAAGTFTVTLTVQDANGGVGTATAAVTVS